MSSKAADEFYHLGTELSSPYGYVNAATAAWPSIQSGSWPVSSPYTFSNVALQFVNIKPLSGRETPTD